MKLPPSIRWTIRRLTRSADPIVALHRHFNKQKLPLRKVIHVGAHHGEEHDLYEAMGVQKILWIEASQIDYKKLCSAMAARPNSRMQSVCANAFVSDTSADEVELRRFNNDGASSSMFRGTKHMQGRWPGLRETGEIERVRTTTLDALAAQYGFDDADVLIVDVQGAELHVFRGAPLLLQHAKAVITEVSREPYYEGGALYPELKSTLESHGLREATEAPSHGDQLYLREGAF